MNGKVVRLASNDVYGNSEDREVSIFICFKDKKYMNNYVIFCYNDELDKKKLYYGSLHIKDNSLICFSTKDNKVLDYINDITNMIINNNIDNNKYEILNISKIEKIEIISSNNIEYDKTNILKEKSIKDILKEEKQEEKKDHFLLYLLIIIILIGIDVFYFYFYSGFITKKYKYMDCSISKYDDDIKVNYIENNLIKFNEKDRTESIEVTLTYEFKDNQKYLNFKENDKQYNYFNKGSYKYNDDDMELKIFYEDDIIITEYEEMKNYLEREGYDCTYGEYQK